MTRKFELLTRPAMRALASGQEIRENGIRFQRLPNGDGRFSVDLKVDRLRVHRVLGLESEGVTREQAEQFIEQIRTEARQGRLKLPKGRKRELGFDEAAWDYLKRQQQEGGKDIPKKTLRLTLHLIPYFGQKPLSQLTTFEIEKYKKHRKDKGAKPSTVNRELAVISHMLNRAVDWDWLVHLPCKVKLLKEDNARIVYLTAEECSDLLDAARDDSNQQIYMFILTGLETAMRRSEILSLRIKNINIPERSVYLPKAKAGARVQPITDRLAHYLERHLQTVPKDQEWLFPSIGSVKTKTGHTTAIEEPFRRVVEAAGLDPKEVTPHTLRHTATTHLVQAGIDLPTVQAITGHKTPAMVHRYAHFNSAHVRAAMTKLEQKYQSAKVVSVTQGRRNAADPEKEKTLRG